MEYSSICNESFIASNCLKIFANLTADDGIWYTIVLKCSSYVYSVCDYISECLAYIESGFREVYSHKFFHRIIGSHLFHP